ncbi:hypothetical protein MYRNA_109 [Mycobacterium phage Myrna]|uniref:Uncharacterized protein n=1 Tax=Mycobacterium phage Myrna TaxID=546805 RepID=B5LJB3_9CAUD|nr:gp109 [Mycobacterium phage Myrna]ACH62110.1 hypothetical protein MYRNA_109 [Mycobacterium phage Myrna]
MLRSFLLACYTKCMSNATAPAALVSISVHTADGAYYIAPTATVAEGILDGMMDAQRHYGQISWEEITMGYARGRVVAPNHPQFAQHMRVQVLPSNLPMVEEDAILNWFDE